MNVILRPGLGDGSPASEVGLLIPKGWNQKHAQMSETSVELEL